MDEQEKTLTKAMIIEEVYERIGFSKKEAADLVESVFQTLKDELRKSNKVKISGFGHFDVKDKKPRRGRNPQTGDDLMISARKVVSFKASQILKDQVNGEAE